MRWGRSMRTRWAEAQWARHWWRTTRSVRAREPGPGPGEVAAREPLFRIEARERAGAREGVRARERLPKPKLKPMLARMRARRTLPTTTVAPWARTAGAAN